MTGSNLEYHIKAVITLKSMEDASSTTFTATTIQESIPSLVSWPIIKSVGSIGANMGDHLPQTSASSITLSNEYGSIGFERRFLDLLERYTIINQQILIYIAVTPIGEFFDGSYELRLAGTIKSVQLNSEDLVINIAGRGIADRIVNTIVTREIFPDASEASLNYALPIIFGQFVQVKPLVVDGGVSLSQSVLAYATNLRHYSVGGILFPYAKGYDSKYHKIKIGTDKTRIFVGNNFVAGKTRTVIALTAYEKIAKRFDVGADGYIATGVTFWATKDYGLMTGSVVFKIQVADQLQNGNPANGGFVPGTVLGTASVDLASFTIGLQDIELRANFDKPVVIPPYAIWFLTIETKKALSPPLNFYHDTAVTESLFYVDIGEGENWKESVSSKRHYWGLFGLSILENSPFGSNDDNIYASALVSQNTTLSGQLPNLEKIDWIFEVLGLKDDTSGTVTGAANQGIESPQRIVELMTKIDNGTSYTGGQFGSEHSSTWPEVNDLSARFYRKVKGKTQGATKLTSLLSDICSSTASRITMHPSTSTPLGYWAWGYTASEVDDINQDECKIISGEIQGTESVVNAAELYYNDELINVDFTTSVSFGEFKSFSDRISTLETTDPIYAEANALTSVSRSIYGNMELGDKSNLWIGDTTSARSMCFSYLRRNLYPSSYYYIEVPYLRFKALKLLDIVRITHPELAAFFGTTPDASRATYAASEVDLSTGFYWARANTIRAQVEGIQTIFDDKNMPKIRLTIKLLNNAADPT
jgi:hypothetical protein